MFAELRDYLIEQKLILLHKSQAEHNFERILREIRQIPLSRVILKDVHAVFHASNCLVSLFRAKIAIKGALAGEISFAEAQLFRHKRAREH